MASRDSSQRVEPTRAKHLSVIPDVDATRELGNAEQLAVPAANTADPAIESLDETRNLDGADESSSGGDDHSELGQGDFVGRYSVLSNLGRGGMGVVYKAYDPQLDRNVALKLLRRDRGSVKADLRLMREARTLAKLKHPNVVAVYDAGLTNHGVFIAMELIDGQTLNDWLEQRRRTVDEILGIFRDAGRGLVAAHEAGFIHRDFKPSNVIVGDDGVVRVLDFGLAHLVDEPEPSGELDFVAKPRRDTAPRRRVTERPSGRGPSVDTREVFSTEIGAVVGTPAFMAPEQILVGQSDHRSEQFAFAMSLLVTLYDRSPPGGETYQERRQSIANGMKLGEHELEVSSSGERVPPRVRQAILRGLETTPEARFSSLQEMLELLEPPRTRWRSLVTGFTLLLGFGVGALVFDQQAERPCEEPATALADVWGPEDRRAVEERFARYGSSDASTSRERIEQMLDDYSTAWVKMYGESCRATFIEHRQSERLFDQRMRCLVRRRNRLRSTIDALVETKDDAQLTQRTIVAYKLPPVAVCADLDYVGAEQPLPDDPEVRGRIAALRQHLDDVDTRYDGGDIAAGLEQAATVVGDARELEYAPLLGEALQRQGQGQALTQRLSDAERTLTEAIRVSERAGDDRTAATAWTWMVFTRALSDASADVAMLKLASQAAVDGANDDTIRSWLLNNFGVLHGQRREAGLALDYLRQALEVKLDLLGERHVDVAISRFNLGNALTDERAYPEAEQELWRAHETFSATMGAAHPMTHVAQRGLCRVSLERGNAAEAVERCEAAMANYALARPTWLLQVQLMLAQAHLELGDEVRAREAIEAAHRHAAGERSRIEQIETWQREHGERLSPGPAPEDQAEPNDGVRTERVEAQPSSPAGEPPPVQREPTK